MDYCSFTIRLARDVGYMILDYLHSDYKMENKHSTFDFVTEVDKESEQMIRTRILETFPDHLFFRGRRRLSE